MKKIAIFCIPAHGHTNPMLPVAKELVKRGNIVKFYSFDEFESKIKNTGAEFVSCTRFLPEINEIEEANLKKSSNTEMTIQDIRITLAMDDFLDKEFKSFCPDTVFTDAVCFWGKLNAWKHNVPLVVSTSTFAFNQLSATYMKNSPHELWDMIGGLPKISKELKTLEPYGYHVKRTLDLIQNDNNTDTIVYTTKDYQPYGESYTDHYIFVGPSVFSETQPDKKKNRPMIYISMGTVVNEKPEFYKNCIEAFKDKEIDVIMSCGKNMSEYVPADLPDNIKAYTSVDQLDVLSKADAFITHCGMNSVSESLYMATPMIFYPQTGEQHAVARRASEIGAGIMLNNDSSSGIYEAAEKLLGDQKYSLAAKKCSEDFRSAPGPKAAAEFIENAPHNVTGTNFLDELNKAQGKFIVLYWIAVIALIVLMGILVGWKFVWIIGVTAGILSYPIGQAVQKKNYASLVKKRKRNYAQNKTTRYFFPLHKR